jgi:hypothetical protein
MKPYEGLNWPTVHRKSSKIAQNDQQTDARIVVMMRGAAAMSCRHEDAGDGEGCIGGRVCESIDALAMAGKRSKCDRWRDRVARPGIYSP